MGMLIDGQFRVSQSTEQAFYFIDQVELSDGRIEHGDWLLSYHGGSLIGIRQWKGEIVDVPVMGYNEVQENTYDYIQFGDAPEFKLLKHGTGEMIDLSGDIPVWESNGIFVVDMLSEVKPLPEKFGLENAYPNPFNPVTTVNFKLPIESQVHIQVFDIQGRLIETLSNGIMMSGGYHSVIWNADDHSSGLYIVKMLAGDHVSTQKLLLVK